jgi:hypothetical protein
MPNTETPAAPRNTEEQLVGRSEGWGSLVNASDAHYFRDGRSLCGRWACFGTPRWETNQALGSRPRRNSGTCVTCWKKREKEETANAHLERLRERKD